MAPSRLLTLLLQVPGCQQSVKITFGFYPGLVELGYHSKQQHTGHRAGFLSEQQYIEYNWSQIWGEICKHQTALPCLFCSTQHYMKVMRYRGTDYCLGWKDGKCNSEEKMTIATRSKLQTCVKGSHSVGTY